MFKFYTAESPPEFFFHGHQNNIRCINWFEDDTGFITSGQDAGVSVWQLYANRGEGSDAKLAEAKQGLPSSEFKSKNVCFSALTIAKSEYGQPLTFYGAGNDKSLREVVRTDITNNKFTEKRYEEGVQYS